MVFDLEKIEIYYLTKVENDLKITENDMIEVKTAPLPLNYDQLNLEDLFVIYPMWNDHEKRCD
jgi:hypothetical protein